MKCPKRIYIFIFFIIYFAVSVMTCINGFNAAKQVPNAFVANYDSGYWLNYRFAFIQFGNNMLLFSGFIACAFGSFYPLLENPLEKIIETNFLYVFISALITLIISFVFTRNQIVTIHFNLYLHSILMMIGFYLYITFWSIISYCLKIIFKKAWAIFFILSAEQYFELYLLNYLSLNKLNLFLPTSISRELVVRQFPFWKSNSWANVENAFPFGNVTMIHNKFFTPLNISFLWIVFMLLLFIIPPLFFYFLKRRKKLNVSSTY